MKPSERIKELSVVTEPSDINMEAWKVRVRAIERFLDEQAESQGPKALEEKCPNFGKFNCICPQCYRVAKPQDKPGEIMSLESDGFPTKVSYPGIEDEPKKHDCHGHHIWDTSVLNPTCHACGQLMRDDSHQESETEVKECGWHEVEMRMVCKKCGRDTTNDPKPV